MYRRCRPSHLCVCYVCAVWAPPPARYISYLISIQWLFGHYSVSESVEDPSASRAPRERVCVKTAKPAGSTEHGESVVVFINTKSFAKGPINLPAGHTLPICNRESGQFAYLSRAGRRVPACRVCGGRENRERETESLKIL